MNCDVIRDLLPLHAEGLASAESVRLIEEHLAGCDGCRALLEQMRAPLEIAAARSEGERYQKALRKERRRRRLKTLLACVLTAFAAALVVLLWRETRAQTTAFLETETDPAALLAERPELALTEAELALGPRLLADPALGEALRAVDGTQLAAFPPEWAEERATDGLPAGARVTEFSANRRNIFLGYGLDGLSITLHYFDGDGSGRPDTIVKVVGLPGDPWAEAIYTLTRDAATGEETFQKHVPRRLLFGLLPLPE